MNRPAFDPLKAGLWPSMVGRNGGLNAPMWERAAGSGEAIGSCRECGGYLAVDEPTSYGETNPMWYVARCLDCGHEIASPGGRVLRTSSRFSERTNGGR